MDSGRDEEEGRIEEDDNYEPSVTSNNPTERIMARRLRIQRRVEALRKQQELQEAQAAAGDDTAIESEIKITPIEQQIERSIELLEKLILEGEEYVTNVRVATEARETDRRESEGIGKEKLLRELEEEAESASAAFREIADKWSSILQYNDPLQINDEIMSQKEKCDELLKQKDAIIAKLKEKLRKEEINFAIDQRKQIEDVNSLSRRIENQIIVMRKAYRQELEMIEDVILAERQILIEASNKKWDELYKKREQEEKNNSEIKHEDYWNFVREMDDLARSFQELYRETNIKLENDCDELQRELERIKADAIMNGEKLDYNYQILKKREDENLIIRSQQKRRINKLQDVINSLRKKNNLYHAQTMQQIEKLTGEVKKLSQNILDVEKKADHVAAVNNEKFKKIWKMNKERADHLFNRILEIDRILYEQQLGLHWTPPEHEPPERQDVESDDKSSAEIPIPPPDQTGPKPGSSQHSKKSLREVAMTDCEVANQNETNPVYKKTINNILNLITDKTGFLIEDQLNAILEPYLEYERTLVKVDNVLCALNVNEKSDIDLLMEYFIPYMVCPHCQAAAEKTAAPEDESLVHVHEMDPVIVDLKSSGSVKLNDANMGELLQEAAVLEQDPGGTVITLGPLSVTLFDDNLKGTCRGPEGYEEHVKDGAPTCSTEDIHTFRVPCHYQHPMMISSVYILKALKEFLMNYHKAKTSIPTMNGRLNNKRTTVSRSIPNMDIEQYWSKYTEIFPAEREQLWDSLLEGLKRYHELLKARKTAGEEVVSLRQQNADLRRLFANYIDKKDVPY